MSQALAIDPKLDIVFERLSTLPRASSGKR